MVNSVQIRKKGATEALKINLCSGPKRIAGYLNIDIGGSPDIVLDLEEKLLPFEENSVETLVCISAINYFSMDRAREIIKDVYRVLKPGGVTRFGTQDLRILAGKYINEDTEFFFQKLPDGRDRFPGRTMGDKLNEWFYGFKSGGKVCRYVYDFESLRELFVEAGFELVERKKFNESRILDISQIDNRPEQMFFLEAIKTLDGPGDDTFGVGSNNKSACVPSDVDSMRKHAFSLWESGRIEEAWQCLLMVLDRSPDDRAAVVSCADVLNSLSRHEDICELLLKYPNIERDVELGRVLQDAKGRSKKTEAEKQTISDTRRKLNQLDGLRNLILPDRTHLAGSIQWIENAMKKNRGGGVAAMYSMDTGKWSVDYPETTGYIIATFISYYKLTGIRSYLVKAIEMGDWEISIQWPEGGVGEPVGVYGKKPRIFNTSQVMLGWMSLYRETGHEKYLAAAKRAGDWIINRQDNDGKWSDSTYNGPKAYHVRVTWALAQLFEFCKEQKYRIAAERSVGWVFEQAYANGWFDNNSLSGPGKPWTHLIGYVLVGLLEVCRLGNINFDRQRAITILYNAAVNISTAYSRSKQNGNGAFVTLSGTFDCNWSSNDNWSCLTGNAQIEFFLRKLACFTGRNEFMPIADTLIDDMKHVQFLDDVDSEEILGGIAGSYPVGGGYCSYAIPNWSVKFFADSLLQRLLPQDEQFCLG